MRRLYVARHGETDWNAEGRWQGHTDVPLNAAGRAQARDLAGRLRGLGIGAVVASDLARASETARIIAAELRVEVAYLDVELRERRLGVFEGLTREQCEERHPDAWRAYLGGRTMPPGAEADDALRGRIVAAAARVVERAAREDVPALAVTHGGALRILVGAITGVVPGPLANGALYELVFTDRFVAARARVGAEAPPSKN